MGLGCKVNFDIIVKSLVIFKVPIMMNHAYIQVRANLFRVML